MYLLEVMMMLKCFIRNAEPVERLKKRLALFYERMTAIVNACSDKKVFLFMILNFVCLSSVHLSCF